MNAFCTGFFNRATRELRRTIGNLNGGDGRAGEYRGLSAPLNPATSSGGGRLVGLGDPDFASRALWSLPAGHRGRTTPLIR
jgi:hypothetical protein